MKERNGAAGLVNLRTAFKVGKELEHVCIITREKKV